MCDIELFNIYDLEQIFTKKGKRPPHGFGIVFCFGTSLISRIIQAKTRIEENEVVPSHVLMVWGNSVLESTMEVVKINHKKIPSGVRCWRLSDWLSSEKDKLTKYYYFETKDLNIDTATDLVHLPYGKDNIVDFLLKDKSEGDRTHGLICSQYTNRVAKLSKQRCPSPADLYRIVLEKGREKNE